jgi:hypothetical protein
MQLQTAPDGPGYLTVSCIRNFVEMICNILMQIGK